MYRCDLSDKFLTRAETDLFRPFLASCHVDEAIWPVFESFFQSATKSTKPLIVRVYDESGLCGAAIIVRCKRYGHSLFNNRFLAGLIDSARIPFYMWIKYGCCMDMMSNPGFVADPRKSVEVHNAIIHYLNRKCMSFMVYDYAANSSLYENATVYPSPPHALIDTSQMLSVEDYLSLHKNIKKKMNIFQKNGGTFEIIEHRLGQNDLDSVKKCFLMTAEKSLFYLPYQDLYLQSALRTSAKPLEQIYYFIARLNGEFLGYQAAIKTGKCLNALHGAFDRERKTTFHAYDLLFAQMTEFAINNGLNSIDFGSVINTTKQRAVNRIIDLSYYIFSNSRIFRAVLNNMLKSSKMLSYDQLKFTESISV